MVCPSNVGITSPIGTTLANPLIESLDYLGTGSTPYVLSLVSADSRCPILTYEATTKPTGVTQTCPTAANTAACQTVSVPLDAILKYSVIYQIFMTGGNSFYHYVDFDVICSNSVVILPPGALYTDPIIFDQDTNDHEVTIT